VIYDVQSEVLRRSNPEAVWRRTGFAFIAESPWGDHIRVWWFPGALAPAPPR
jgi:hypothetical protein